MSIEVRLRRLEAVEEQREPLRSQVIHYPPGQDPPKPPADGRIYLIIPDNGRGHKQSNAKESV